MAKAKLETELEKPPVEDQAGVNHGSTNAAIVTGDGTGQALAEIAVAPGGAEVTGAAIVTGDETAQALSEIVTNKVLEMLKGPTIVVRGPAKGRWRIGRHFTPEPTSIQARELNEAQWHALNGDPELFVTVVDPPD